MTTAAPANRVKDTIGIAPMKVDAKKMYTRAVVNTPRVDRDWEIVVPEGWNGEALKASGGPWFINHQMGIPWIVGTSRERPKDPNCPLDIKVSPDGIEQGCFWNQASKEAEIVFRLVELGHWNATSIGFKELDRETMSEEESRNLGAPWPIRRITKWEHVETSWVGVGANPEAITIHLEKGFVGSLAIPDTLKPMFQAQALSRKYFRIDSQDRFHSPTLQSGKSKNREGKAMPTEEQRDQTEHGEEMARAPSHDALECLTKGCHQLMCDMEPHVAKMEDHEVKPHIVGHMKKMWEGVDKLHEDHGEKYEGLDMPELPEGIQKAFDAHSDEEVEDEEIPEGSEVGDKEEADEMDEAEEKQWNEMISRKQIELKKLQEAAK